VAETNCRIVGYRFATTCGSLGANTVSPGQQNVALGPINISGNPFFFCVPTASSAVAQIYVSCT
jgi:hypothetical protein